MPSIHALLMVPLVPCCPNRAGLAYTPRRRSVLQANRMGSLIATTTNYPMTIAIAVAIAVAIADAGLLYSYY